LEKGEGEKRKERMMMNRKKSRSGWVSFISKRVKVPICLASLRVLNKEVNGCVIVKSQGFYDPPRGLPREFFFLDQPFLHQSDKGKQ